ncbi:MAG: M28 family peptidase [Tidjanibacter sp.]|nr:M28 family peptidase [Tidjanibacter sp.]
MKRFAKGLFVALLLTLSSAAASAQQGKGLDERLKEHLYYLTSDELRGREAGTEDAAKASDYIAEQFAAMGLEPYIGESYFQYFTVPTAKNKSFRNVIGIIEGTNPELSNRYIVVGAHYDHLGVQLGKTYPGADDNASGTSALIEVARNLLVNRSTLGRSIIIVAFDAEEMGLYGSTYLAEVMPTERIDLMISMDMVGWLAEAERLTIEGAGTIKDGVKWLAEVPYRGDMKLNLNLYENSLFTATDTRGFAQAGVPTFAVTTGTVSPYHKPGDTADKIDFQGLQEITLFMTSLITEASKDASFGRSGKVASIHSSLPIAQLGLTAVSGRSSMRWPDSALRGKDGYLLGAGATMQFNIGRWFTLRTGARYEWASPKWPSDNKPFGAATRLRTEQLTTPLTLGARLSLADTRTYTFISAGWYYTQRYKASVGKEQVTIGEAGIAREDYGPMWEFGMNAGKWQLTVVNRYGITDLFTTPTQGKTRTRNTYCEISYFF